ncbi:L,D-transpeptidase family protein [Jiella sp. MQZ9-1]|uniref:L,D-transpeptidase family protein n=1 Tax=Jiella flava TaxID=2816857 RepID=A0A939FSI4_9HYPH|nr:L,D-transpeptidase family protein [Jiella flava]MBO0661103.1 L,D-transpeptidase family protein [Jiella flava]MCD2469750.1 L,D-transpeptidase family protein [Jiella flava]
MTRAADRDTLASTRRQFLLGAAAVGLGMAPGSAFAQNALSEILNAPSRGNWDDQFDTRGISARQVSSATPIFSNATLMSTQAAVNAYQGIVSSGGWPQVPEVGTLRIGVDSQAVPALRQRLTIAGDLAQGLGMSTAFDTYVEAAVKRFQARHGLPVDGVVSKYTYKAINVPADLRLNQLMINVGRLQQMVSKDLGQRFVMVNIPAAAIEAVENGQVVQRHTAIVGKIDRQTPILESKIINLNLNPYWHAPASIVRKDIIPLMQKDPTYLEKANIHIFDHQGNEIPPQSINWNSDDAVKYLFRQDPGKDNAMASVKINFPNPHSVYMHDTPEQSLFSNLMRFDSSGCVRVQNVRDLVVWLARDTPGWDRQKIEQVIASRQREDVDLVNPVPVYFTYITAWATDPNVVQFRDDIYHRDGSDQLAMSDLKTTAYTGNQKNPYVQGDEDIYR